MVLGAAVCVSSCALRAEIDYGSRVNGDEPRLYVDRYGMGDPTVVSNGYLFVEFEYIPAPYHIQRVGQAVVVNGVIVNCLFRRYPPVGERAGLGVLTEAKLKKTDDFFVGYLTEYLQMHEVLFLHKSGYQNRDPFPIREDKMSLRVPIFNRFNDVNFPHLLNDAMTNQSPEVAINAITRRAFRQGLTTNHVQTIIEKARQNPQLLERIRAEIGFTPEPAGGE